MNPSDPLFQRFRSPPRYGAFTGLHGFANFDRDDWVRCARLQMPQYGSAKTHRNAGVLFSSFFLPKPAVNPNQLARVIQR